MLLVCAKSAFVGVAKECLRNIVTVMCMVSGHLCCW